MYEEIQRAAVQDALGMFKLAAGPPGVLRSIWRHGLSKGLAHSSINNPEAALRASASVGGALGGGALGGIAGAIYGGVTAEPGEGWRKALKDGAIGTGIGAGLGGVVNHWLAGRAYRALPPTERFELDNSLRDAGELFLGLHDQPR